MPKENLKNRNDKNKKKNIWGNINNTWTIKQTLEILRNKVKSHRWCIILGEYQNKCRQNHISENEDNNIFKNQMFLTFIITLIQSQWKHQHGIIHKLTKNSNNTSGSIIGRTSKNMLKKKSETLITTSGLKWKE